MRELPVDAIEVRPPDINISTGEFEIATDTMLYIPFNRIKGISDNTTNAIIVRARKPSAASPIAPTATAEPFHSACVRITFHDR